MNPIEVFIRNLIKRGTVSNSLPDTGAFPVAQVKWASDKVGNVEVLAPYGYSYNPPVGSLALMLSVLGHEENRAAIINAPTKRLRKLQPGEVAIGNWEAKSFIKFWNNGDIEISCKGNQNITISGDCNLTVNGNVNLNSSGNVSATVGGSMTANITGNTEITSPTVKITGALNVTGEVTALFGTPAAVTFSGIVSKYNSHTHISAAPGNATSAPTPLLP